MKKHSAEKAPGTKSPLSSWTLSVESNLRDKTRRVGKSTEYYLAARNGVKKQQPQRQRKSTAVRSLGGKPRSTLDLLLKNPVVSLSGMPRERPLGTLTGKPRRSHGVDFRTMPKRRLDVKMAHRMETGGSPSPKKGQPETERDYLEVSASHGATA